MPKDNSQSCQELILSVADTDFCADGEWRVNARELLDRLQKSNGAIPGTIPVSPFTYPDTDNCHLESHEPIRLLYPSRANAQYKTCFLKGKIEDGIPDPSKLIIGKDNIFRLHVDHDVSKTSIRRVFVCLILNRFCFSNQNRLKSQTVRVIPIVHQRKPEHPESASTRTMMTWRETCGGFLNSARVWRAMKSLRRSGIRYFRTMKSPHTGSLLLMLLPPTGTSRM